MAALESGTGYSAQVRLRLQCAGRVIPLSQVAPEWVIPSECHELAPGPGEIIVEVDGREQRRRVYLPQGMSRDSVRVVVQPQVPVT